MPEDGHAVPTRRLMESRAACAVPTIRFYKRPGAFLARDVAIVARLSHPGSHASRVCTFGPTQAPQGGAPKLPALQCLARGTERPARALPDGFMTI